MTLSLSKKSCVRRNTNTRTRFILKAGRYDVECRGKGENTTAKQTEISVVAGQVLSVKIQE